MDNDNYLLYFVLCLLDLTEEERNVLQWVLSVPFQENGITHTSMMSSAKTDVCFELGPR